jgi:multiple sugar transport system permease protein
VPSHETKQFAKGMAFLSPWIIGFSVFTFIPAALSVYYSLCDYSIMQPPAYIGLRNYHDLLHDTLLWTSLWNAVYYGLLTLPAGLVLALGLAMLLNVKIPGQAFFRTIIFLPSLLPAIATATVWLWMYNTRLGVFNTLLAKIGIEGPGWMTDPHWSMPSLAIIGLWSVGNSVVINLAALQDVPRELYEAAEIDGAGLWRRIWHVTLPAISPVIFFNLIMAIIGVMSVLDAPFLMTQGLGSPLRTTYFISMYLRDTAFLYLRMGYASAVAWLMLLVVLLLTGFAFWTSKRWVHYQGK